MQGISKTLVIGETLECVLQIYYHYENASKYRFALTFDWCVCVCVCLKFKLLIRLANHNAVNDCWLLIFSCHVWASESTIFSEWVEFKSKIKTAPLSIRIAIFCIYILKTFWSWLFVYVCVCSPFLWMISKNYDKIHSTCIWNHIYIPINLSLNVCLFLFLFLFRFFLMNCQITFHIKSIEFISYTNWKWHWKLKSRNNFVAASLCVWM